VTIRIDESQDSYNKVTSETSDLGQAQVYEIGTGDDVFRSWFLMDNFVYLIFITHASLSKTCLSSFYVHVFQSVMHYKIGADFEIKATENVKLYMLENHSICSKGLCPLQKILTSSFQSSQNI